MTSFLSDSKVPTIPQPLYSPDVAPLDFFLFPRLKTPMKGHHFVTVEKVKEACTEALKDIPEKAYRDAIDIGHKNTDDAERSDRPKSAVVPENITKVHNSRLCTKDGMVTIVTSAKCSRPSLARAVFTRVTSSPCRSRYTRHFVSKLMEKVALRASGMNILPVEAGDMNISPVQAGGMNIPPDCVAEAQLAACCSTRKHAMLLFLPFWTQNSLGQW